MLIPKAQKYSQIISLFALLGSVRVKVAHKMLVISTPGEFTGSLALQASSLPDINYKSYQNIFKVFYVLRKLKS